MAGRRVQRTFGEVLVAGVLATALALGASPASASTASSQRAAVKDPVIIVAGTLAGHTLASVYYAPLAARLRSSGYTVFIWGLPGSGLGDIAATARSLNTYADAVRAQTGAARVDLIGHSQGGLVARHYVKYGGGATEVDSLISLAAPHHGTVLANVGQLVGLGNCVGVIACTQMTVGSPFLNALNAGDDTIGNVAYTNFSTIEDEIVVPYTSAFLDDDGNNTNVKIQRQCPLRVVDHVSIPLDGTVYSGITDALAHQPITLNCFAV